MNETPSRSMVLVESEAQKKTAPAGNRSLTRTTVEESKMATYEHTQRALSLLVDPAKSARFWAKVDKTGTCWLWTGSTDGNGYGGVRVGGVLLKAHRAAYFMEHGHIDPELNIDHRCHTRLCVRPDHLRLVTQGQNMQNLSGAQSNSKSGIRGVCWAGHAKMWRVYANIGRRRIYGGYYHDLGQAEQAAIDLRCSLFTHNDVDRGVAA